MPDDSDLIPELFDVERMSDDDLMTTVAGMLIQFGAENGDEDLIKRRDAVYAEFDKRMGSE